MQLFAFGINHQTAPLAVREQLAFNVEAMEPALRDLVGNGAVKEATILSTCNRTEIYCSTSQPAQAVDWLASYHHLPAADIEPYIYRLPHEQAVKHAFRVASGLDSMVLGEPQILGQMKQAVRQAEQAGTLGFLLHKLFQRTFSVAKDVRTQTEIGANLVSMAAAAVKLAERIFPSIAEQRVLFIGAGEMIELNAVHFAARSPQAHYRGEPHAGTCASTGASHQWPCHHAERIAGTTGASRHHRYLHRQSAADFGQGHGRACA